MKTDNPFTSKLYNHTLPVREEVWESIEKQLPPKEEEKRFPFFWFMLFASTLISGALMFGILNKKSSATPSPVPSPSYTLSTPSTVNSSEASTLHINNSSSTNSNSYTNNSTITNNANHNDQNSVTTKAESAYTSTTEQESSSANASISSSAAAAVSTSTKSNTANHNQKTKSSSNKASTSNSADVIPAFEQTAVSEAITRSLVSRSNYSTSLLPLADVDELNKPGVDVIGIRKSKPDPNCYKFSGIAGNYYFSVDAFAGPGFSPRSFTAVDSESSSYTQARETTESNQYAWSAGARINLNLRNGLAFRLGLMYDQAGDVFDYTDTLAAHSTFVVDSFWSADGTFLYSDTSRILIFGTLIKKIHNTYRHLDVPLLASYEIPLGRSSSLMINAGPVFNLSASYEGQILDPMLHPRSITPGSQNELYAYKTSLGISLYLGAGVVFPITDKISGLIEPRYLYRIKPVTIKSYPLEEHRHFAGLNLGLRYYLD